MILPIPDGIKKIFFLPALILIFTATSFAEVKVLKGYVDGLIGYSLYETQDVISLPSESRDYQFSSSFGFGFNGVLLFTDGEGLYGLYIKKDHVDVSSDGTAVLSAEDGYEIIASEKWGLHYLGAGLRKYFFTEEYELKKILPFIGMDFGLFFASNNEAGITVRDINGYTVANGTLMGTGGFFGATADAGFDFWFYDSLGMSLRGGYRICSGRLRAIIETGGDLKPAGINDLVDRQVTYSGFFVQAGVLFNFQTYE